LTNTSLEQIVVLHDELNVVNWKVNKHTSDLWSFLADQLINEFVEDCTNLILVVRVLWNDSWEDLVGSHDVPLVDSQLLLLNLMLLCLNLLLDLLLCDHLLLRGRLLHVHLGLHSHLLMLHTWLSHHVTVLLMLVLSIPLPSGSITLTTWLILSTSVMDALWSSSWSSSSLLLHQEWHTLDEKLQVILEFFLVSKVSPLGTLCVCLTELLETTLVFSGFVLQLANLFDLVVVDG